MSSSQMAKETIVVIDDEPKIAWLFSHILDGAYVILGATTGGEGLRLVGRKQPALVFLDLRLSDISGLEVLQELHKRYPELLVIMLTAHETVETAVQAMKLGAYDYVPKPMPEERLKIIIENALTTSRLAQRVHQLEARLTKQYTLADLQGLSPPMEEVKTLIRRVAPHDVTVLLLGESGTGKELVARVIHAESPRCRAPFVPVDCAALPETLIETELFGHEKGAFTGATCAKPGKFEQAHGGTLFLDEIGNLTAAVQAKLLRAIQEREVRRIGSTGALPIDVRILAATNQDLASAVAQGTMREDLYHRLNVFPIQLPPLRARGGDVLYLAKRCLVDFGLDLKKSVRDLAPATEALFRAYSWPGNVRELQNVLKHALLMCANADTHLEPQHLPDTIRQETPAASLASASRRPRTLRLAAKEARRQVERELILQTLAETGWNKRKAAARLKIDYKTLFNKLKAYDIPRRAAADTRKEAC